LAFSLIVSIVVCLGISSKSDLTAEYVEKYGKRLFIPCAFRGLSALISVALVEVLADDDF
jgi:Mn2+/Fe2+ NRAMP family transporter